MRRVSLRNTLTKTVGGGTPDRNEPTLWGGEIPWVTVKDFKDGVHKLEKAQESITQKGLRASASNLIPPNTPIVCTRMAVGRIAFSETAVAINQDLRALFVSENYDREYIVWAVQSIREKLANVAIGSTVAGISVDALLRFEIPDPPRAEQSKIAEILSTVDRAIEQTEALLAKQERVKTGLMQDLLTRGIDEEGRLRSEETHEFKDSPLGRIPVEWEVKKLGRALRYCGGHLQTGPFGSQLHASDYRSEGIPVVMPQDIVGERISTSVIARISASKAAELKRQMLRENDVVFSRRGDLTKAASVGNREAGWLCGTGCFLLRVSAARLNTRWLVDVYRHSRVQKQVDINAIGSTMQSLNNAVMEGLEIAFPSVNEQERIVEVEENLRASVEAIGSARSKLTYLKTGLMQDLLTGRKRVTPLLKQKAKAATK